MRLEMDLSGDDARRLEALSRELKAESRTSEVAATLAEFDLWRKTYGDDKPIEYVLPDGRRMKNRAAIEADASDRILGPANEVFHRIHQLEAEISRLRAKANNAAQDRLSAISVFVSHASEDKDEVARLLAEMLAASRIRVWYDEYSLRIGDSLRQSIDRGLSECTHGVVIISPAFIAKRWTQYELDGLVLRDLHSKEKVLLPVWHNVSMDQVLAFSPPIAGRIAADTRRGMTFVASEIVEAVAASGGNGATP